jgi:hypothetical protein
VKRVVATVGNQAGSVAERVAETVGDVYGEVRERVVDVKDRVTS